MDKVPDKDIMLEPTELGKHYGLSGKAMNKKLAELELQVKANGEWRMDRDIQRRTIMWTSRKYGDCRRMGC